MLKSIKDCSTTPSANNHALCIDQRLAGAQEAGLTLTGQQNVATPVHKARAYGM
jgi:hypothetical protein